MGVRSTSARQLLFIGEKLATELIALHNDQMRYTLRSLIRDSIACIIEDVRGSGEKSSHAFT